jgi:hypothetical protein
LTRQNDAQHRLRVLPCHYQLQSGVVLNASGF